MTNQGILIAADKNVEWMMPWWHINFFQHNEYPVAIVDLGMSDNGRMRASSIGQILTPQLPTLSHTTPDPQALKKWREMYTGNLEQSRQIWLMKPFLLSHSPFNKTIWIDLDCKVRGPICPVFGYCATQGGLAVAQEPLSQQTRWRKHLNLVNNDEMIYNSGVISYQKNAPILKAWQTETLERHAQYYADDIILSRVLYQTKMDWKPLPFAFNSRLSHADNPEMIIIHYLNAHRKLDIMEELLLNLATKSSPRADKSDQ